LPHLLSSFKRVNYGDISFTKAYGQVYKTFFPYRC
jgi:hypothetical protein